MGSPPALSPGLGRTSSNLDLSGSRQNLWVREEGLEEAGFVQLRALFLAFCLADTAACAVPKESLEEAGDAARLISLNPGLWLTLTVFSHCFCFDGIKNRMDFILYAWWF